METVSSQFLPVFFAAKKANSLRNQIRLMELYYGLPADILHQLRINRTKKQRDIIGTSNEGAEETALDLMMGRLMPFLKGVPHEGSEASFETVSKMLKLGQRSKKLVEFYTKNRKDAEYEWMERLLEEDINAEFGLIADPMQNRKKTTVPTSVCNRVVVMEILVSCGVHQKIVPSRPRDKQFFWKTLDKCIHTAEQKEKVSMAKRHCTTVQQDDTHLKKMAAAIVHGDSMNTKMTTSFLDETELVGESGTDTSLGESDDRSCYSDESDKWEVVELLEFTQSWRGGNDETMAVNETSTEVDNLEAASVGDVLGDELFLDGEIMTSQDAEHDEFLTEERQMDAGIVVEEALDDAVDDDESEEDDSALEENEKDTAPSQPKSRADVKFMTPMDINPTAMGDIISIATKQMKEKNVLQERSLDITRKEREQFFLRNRLAGTLNSNDSSTETMQNEIDATEGLAFGICSEEHTVWLGLFDKWEQSAICNDGNNEKT